MRSLQVLQGSEEFGRACHQIERETRFLPVLHRRSLSRHGGEARKGQGFVQNHLKALYLHSSLGARLPSFDRIAVVARLKGGEGNKRHSQDCSRRNVATGTENLFSTYIESMVMLKAAGWKERRQKGCFRTRVRAEGGSLSTYPTIGISRLRGGGSKESLEEDELGEMAAEDSPESTGRCGVGMMFSMEPPYKVRRLN